MRTRNIKACRTLLEAGTDPNVDAGTGAPLLDAVRHGFADVVELLIDRGADIGGKQRFGRSLLHVAASDGDAEVVRATGSGRDTRMITQCGIVSTQAGREINGPFDVVVPLLVP